jgi:hypothetical protein
MLLFTLLATGWISAPAAAQQVWTSLDGSPAGTPAELTLDQAASNNSDSFFDVIIHGFWTESIAPGDGFTYDHVLVPGLGRLGTEGAPDLPVARLRLVTSNLASTLNLVSAVDLSPNVFSLLPYPFVVQATDELFDPSEDPGPGSSTGTPDVFVKDGLIYGGATAFPGLSATPIALVDQWMDSVPKADVEVYPASYDPSSGLLSVSGHLRVHFQAAATSVNYPDMSPDRALLAAAMFDNWPEHQSLFPVGAVDFGGDYLVLTPAAYVDTLEPFLQHKQLQGFDVDVITLESLVFVTCGQIRGAIDTWYQAGDVWDDRYVLLVGDRDALPQCPSPTIAQILGDDLYGSPSDSDLDEEVFVGRLSVDDADDLASQIAKIIAYQKDGSSQHFDEALLVAHREGAPGKYEGAHESVATAAYAQAPSFEKLYGSQFGADNLDVRQAIDAGVGVVAYRGHGSESTWSDWTGLQDFHKNEILSLSANSNPNVVWAFDCWNSRIAHSGGGEDSIGEVWLEGPGGSTAAHYGSTDVSGTAQNHELDRRMFEAVFDKGLLRQGQAIAWAEKKMADAEPGSNSWMYMLLGDPSMRIKAVDPVPMLLTIPDEVEVCPTGGGPCSFVVRVTDDQNNPLEGVLVTAMQFGEPGEPPLFQVEAYTGSGGSATMPGLPDGIQSAPTVTASDPYGNEADGIMGVVSVGWATFGGGLEGKYGAPAMAGEGVLSAGTPASLEMQDANENALAGLFASQGSTPVPFKGGTLVAFPPIIEPILFPTDPQGEVLLQTIWPGGVPADTEFWFQIAVSDPDAVKGVALSNGVRAITP